VKASPAHPHDVTGTLTEARRDISVSLFSPTFKTVCKLWTHKLELRLVLSSCPLCDWSFSLLTDRGSGRCCWKKQNKKEMSEDEAERSLDLLFTLVNVGRD